VFYGSKANLERTSWLFRLRSFVIDAHGMGVCGTEVVYDGIKITIFPKLAPHQAREMERKQ